MSELSYISNGTALQGTITATGNGNVLPVSGFNTGVFDVQGTFVATAVFEASTDKTVWNGLQVTNVASGASGTTATTTGLYKAGLSGISYVRARVSDYTSGTMSIFGRISSGASGGGAGGGANITAGTINLATVVGNIADNAADSGNPVKIGGVYQGTAQVYASGDRTDLQTDASGYLKNVEQYAPGYEDNTNGVAGVLMKPVNSSTYQASLFTNLGGSVASIVKASAGNVYSAYACNLSGSVAWLQFHNVATVSPQGSVPVYSFMLPPGTTNVFIGDRDFSPSHNFTTGIAVSIGTAAGTLGTTGLTAANFVYHVHYV
mgnify:CR=1 FL=1